MPRFQAYLTRTALGVYTRTFWFGSVRDLLFRWTRSGTASGSVWNGSISSRVNARPIRTVLVRFHMEPFPCKRGLSYPFLQNYKPSTNTWICQTGTSQTCTEKFLRFSSSSYSITRSIDVTIARFTLLSIIIFWAVL